MASLEDEETKTVAKKVRSENPSSRLISKIESPELDILDKIIQFVPKECTEDYAFAEQKAEEAKNAEVADIKILSQFKLRYLCRRFRDILHRLTPLTLTCFEYCPDTYGAFLSDRAGIRLSRNKPLDRFSELPNTRLESDEFHANCQEQFVGRNKSICLVGNICSVDWSFGPLEFSDEDDPEAAENREQFDCLPVLLCHLAEVIGRPLQLSILEYNLVCEIALAPAIKDFHIPLKPQVPSVSLEKLCLGFVCPNSDDIELVGRSVKYLLEFGQHSLVKLDINLFLLKSIFVTENDGTAVLPASWTCETLQTLSVDLDPCDESDPPDDEANAAFIAFCATLPRIFPNLKKVILTGNKPDIDLSGFGGFNCLVAVKLGIEICPTDEQCQQLTLLRSPDVSFLSLVATEELLLKVNMDLPKLTSLKYHFDCSEDSFKVFKQRLDTVSGSFQRLQELVLKSKFFSDRTLPSYWDLVTLLRSLRHLPSLTSLRLELQPESHYDCQWCSPGDLSIIQVLPGTIRNTRFVYALLPAGVSYNREAEKYNLNCPENVPFDGEAIYTDWLRSLLCRVAKHPSIERFYCLCSAPGFEAIYALAAKWGKSAASAIAALDLASVTHVQCAAIYFRMIAEGVPARGDRFKLRFVLEPRSESQNTAAPKRKVVTVVFQNPF